MGGTTLALWLTLALFDRKKTGLSVFGNYLLGLAVLSGT